MIAATSTIDSLGLNESTVYTFRIKSMNIYGESPWTAETPVQTAELIVTSDGRQSIGRRQSLIALFRLDLPQLHVVSYNVKEHFLHFDYLPSDDRLLKITNEQLCLSIRQSPDGSIYHPINQCLPIHNNRVQWTIEKEFAYLKLSICSKKNSNICGQEIEMKEGALHFITNPH